MNRLFPKSVVEPGRSGEKSKISRYKVGLGSELFPASLATIVAKLKKSRGFGSDSESRQLMSRQQSGFVEYDGQQQSRRGCGFV